MGLEQQLLSALDKRTRRRLRRAVFWTRAGLILESLVQSFWPLATLVMGFGGAILLGALEQASLIVTQICAAGALIGVLIALAYGLRRFRIPSYETAKARLDATLLGRPIQALEDQVVQGGAEAEHIWQVHRARMADRLRSVRSVGPQIRLAERDPFASRYIAMTVLLCGIVFGSFDHRVSLTAVPSDVIVATGPNWEGWVRPPSYAGKPTLYLGDLERGFDVPKGSEVTLKFYTDDGVLTLRETVSEDADADPMDFAIAHPGQIEIDGPTGRLWDVALQPDGAPIAELIDDMTRAPSGEARQSFRLEDDIGVLRATLTIARDVEKNTRTQRTNAKK